MSGFNYWQSKKDGNWYWHLKAGNNKIILANKLGHVCTSEPMCMSDIDFVIRHALLGDLLEDFVLRQRSANNQFYAQIRSDHIGLDIVGSTETYTRRHNMEKGLRSIVKNAMLVLVKKIDDPNA